MCFGHNFFWTQELAIIIHSFINPFLNPRKKTCYKNGENVNFQTMENLQPNEETQKYFLRGWHGRISARDETQPGLMD